MADQPSLFDPVNTSKKRATRYRIDITDDHGNLLWDVLVHESPPHQVLTALRAAGLRAVRPQAKGDPDRHSVYSELDPVASIAAAREAHARRATKRSAVLELLLRYQGRWVSRENVRHVGGDSGDRRVRELRQDGWPIEILQERDGQAWSVRLNLPAM